MSATLKLPKFIWAFILPFLVVQSVFGQIQVNGTVTDSEEGTPLTGATVLLVGGTTGAFTDDQGNFTLEVPAQSSELEISYIGYATQRITVGNQTSIKIQLAADYSSLDEVVVVGYGTKKKVDITGSISSVSQDDFEAQPITRVSDILQGRTAGVQINNTNGSPGNNAKIRIRGTNSITGSGNPLIVLDGVIGASLGAINPADIQTIQVLKDASATALYGSRGANGVVLVTTKQGTQNKTSVNFDAFWGMQSLPKKIDVVDGATYATLVNEQLALDGSAPAFSEADIQMLADSGGTDWQDEIYRSPSEALQQNYSVSFSGKKDGLGYFISGNIVNNEGMLVNNYYDRVALRSNLTFDVNDRIDVGLNMTYSKEQALNGFISNLLFAPNAAALIFDPTSPAYAEDGTPTKFAPYGSIAVSPLASALGREDLRDTWTQTGTFFLNYRIAKGLTYSFTGGIRNVNYTGSNFVAGYASTGVNVANVFNNDFSQLQQTHLLQYQNTFSDIHNLTVKAVFEEQAISSYANSALGSGLLVEDVKINNIGFADVQQIQSGQSQEAIRSFVGRVEYDLANKYLITATARVDGSSKFSKENRYSVFPSVALAWRISQENFLVDSDVLSNLKLRASIGQIGNQAVNPYSSFGLLQFGLPFNAVLDNQAPVIGIAPGRFANPDLKWETTTQIDAGFDIGFWDGRLFGSFDYYQKNTTDLLLNVSVPTYTGISTELRNVGEVENKGFEIDMGAVIINSDNFWWETSFNFSHNKTKVLNIGDADAIFPGSGFAGSASIISRVEVGDELGNFFGYINEGTYGTDEEELAAQFGKVPGDTKYADLNGDGVINGDDVTIIGNGAPDFFWGMNNTMAYKGFELNIFIQSIMGHDIFNVQRAIMMGASGDVGTPTHADILDRWTPDNQDTDVPAFSGTNFQAPEDSRFIEDGTFVRLRNVRLSYTLTPEQVGAKFFQGMTFFASGQNLLTLTNYKGYDPEVSGSGNSNVDQSIDNGTYPNPRVVTLGVNLSF
ncbi:TonB-dependent receptor [Pontibacter sp. G13]|uniref:SusC/RagA family TonB-linked outer membrane protein n=1 Tax=Pontibacter sp. G13 TaxID=3074898 RepID=UPI002889B170|nr:TonB-dependent receptor [Pontibacter sp. G13]WNJ19108.1 TonB-dependent receptor [Pontibacter sp. G13]